MKKPYTIVQFALPLPFGDIFHRMTWPMQALGALPEFRVVQVDHMSPYSYQLAMESDLLIMCMVWDLDLIPIIRWRRATGKPTVFELNDYIFDMQPWNPSFDIWNHPRSQTDCIYIMGLCDLIQTSTPFLVKAFEPYCKRVVAFPNQLFNVPEGLPAKPERPIVIGWGGSEGHLHDIAHVAPAVSKWVCAHDDAALWVMGCDTIPRLFDVPREKLRYHLWSSMDGYHAFLKEIHIGLAPLRDTPYNRGRSDVKWLEYAANGCVFVGQRLSTYLGSVQDGKTGFLFSDNAELLRILDKLYADHALADSVRRAAFEQVTRDRRYEAHVQERATVYRELLEQRPSEAAKYPDLPGTSKFPRIELPQPLPPFFAVRLPPDEQKALAELYTDRANISEDSVRLVEQRYGEFHLTNYSRAVIAYARRDLMTAEQRLRRSLSLYPAALRSWCAFGQILLSQRRFPEARDALARALELNPEYEFAYPHLVTANELLSDWPAAVAAAEQWEKCRRQDPRARLRRGLTLIRGGQAKEGIASIQEAVDRFKENLTFWQLPIAEEITQTLQQAEPLAAKEEGWADLVVKAAEAFPHGLWLASRAGAICFHRGEYERGAHILQEARERLLAWEWLTREGPRDPQQYRKAIELHRLACEGLVKEAERT